MGIIRFIKNQFRHDRNTKALLNKLQYAVSSCNTTILENTIRQRTYILNEQCMHCTEKGISDERYCDEDIIVSLTSFGNRIHEVYLAIESIMQGTIKPNKIVLWLAEDEFKGKNLPITLKKQQQRGLEIDYCEDIRSYKKIVPSMKKYPNACIITIDDDVMYDFDLVENLVASHLTHPEAICANRIHRIKTDNQHHPLSYLEWDMEIDTQEISNYHFLTGAGGNLFPPHCFIDDFFDDKKFMELCPYADDVWINAMIWLSNKHIVKSYTHSECGQDGIDNKTSQKDALSNENTDTHNCRNDVQIKAIFGHYNLYRYL